MSGGGLGGVGPPGLTLAEVLATGESIARAQRAVRGDCVAGRSTRRTLGTMSRARWR